MYEFGTIVLVPFPFTDLTASKVRPALIVSKENDKGDDIILCFISSREGGSARAMLLPSGNETGLKVRSVLRFDKIATLSKRVILGKLGRADVEDLRKNRELFFSVFGF